jgi:hypothetical protein
MLRLLKRKPVSQERNGLKPNIRAINIPIPLCYAERRHHSKERMKTFAAQLDIATSLR